MRRIDFLLVGFLALAVAAGARAETFAYVYDGSVDKLNTPRIFAFEFNTRSGAFTAVPGSPFAVPDTASDCNSQCQTIDYSKKRKTLVVSGPTGLSSFLVNPDGSLSLVTGSPFPGGELTGVATVQIGKQSFVYSANFDTTDLHGFSIGTDGALTPITGSPFPSGLEAPGGAQARKRFLFVANQPTDAPSPPGLGVFAIGSDGTPTAAPGSPLDLTGTFSYNVGADPTGKFVYVADDADGVAEPIQVHAIQIDKKTGTPTPVAGSPFDTNLPYEFQAGAVAGKGIVVAAASNAVDDDLSLFAAKKGVLTQLGSGQDSDLNLRVHTFGGKFLYTASPERVRAVAIRKSDGAIDLSASGLFEVKTTVNPIGIVVITR